MFYLIFDLPKNSVKKSQDQKVENSNNFFVCLNKDLETLGFLSHPLLLN